MKNIFTLFFLSLCCLVNAQNIIQVTANISTNTTWTAGNIYVINGYIHVDSAATLTILPGTIVKGKADDGSGSILSTLIVNRGGKLVADGTANQPIVFTSEKAIGARGYGDWGGIVLCGRATINPAGGQAEVEGTPAGTAYYGGPNDDDSSGVMRYVRIEFCGIPLQPNKEINGLTLSGVGRKTVLDHIQISYSGDDSFEWFGGTVNAKHLIAFHGWDDDFDTDFGWRGKVQYAVSQRDSQIADQSGSNGFESDNDANGSVNPPNTQGIFSNVTSVGPLATLVAGYNSNFKRAMHLRRNTKLSVHNSIEMGWPIAFYLDGTAAETNATANELQVRNNVFAGCKDSFLVATGSLFDLRTWYYTGSFSNVTYATAAEVQLTAPFNYAAPDFKPMVGSPVLSGADFTNGNLNGDSFFETVSYRGAFGPTDWTDNWANWDPQNTSYELVSNDPSKSDLSIARVYPNPSSGSISLEFHLVNPSNGSIELFDVAGRRVLNVFEGTFHSGLNSFSADISALQQGVYFLRIQDASSSKTLKVTKL